jgi:hypothetical protein
MKRKIIFIFGILLILTVTWMGYISIMKLNKQKAVRNTQNDLTQMLNQLGHAEVNAEPSSILIFFNSECEHCQWEMQEISQKINQLGQQQLFLASFEPQQEAIAFLTKYGLSGYYIKSTPEKVMASFSGGLPQALIYRNGKLVKHFKGEVKISDIMGALGNETL